MPIAAVSQHSLDQLVGVKVVDVAGNLRAYPGMIGESWDVTQDGSMAQVFALPLDAASLLLLSNHALLELVCSEVIRTHR